MATVTTPPEHRDVQTLVQEIVDRAREAQREFEGYTQEQVDDVVRGVAWACYERGNAEALARLAVETTGLGRVEDKIVKNQRKTKGTLADLMAARTVGVIREDPETGITEIAKPVGVVAAICPSTNPAATPVNKAMMALKGRNAVIIAPSPKGAQVCAALLGLIHHELDKVGAPRDLVLALPEPASKDLTYALMRACDLVVATGSQANVKAAYSSGKPAIGVGSGNVPVIIDESADLADAATKVRVSKTFDYATSCSSENSVVVLNSVYDRAIAALEAEGGYMLAPRQVDRLRETMWIDGKLNTEIVAQSPQRIAALIGLDGPEVGRAEFLMVPEDGVGRDHPFSGEKLSPVLAVYRVGDFDEAVERVQEILDFQGAGHSCGIHTKDPEHAERLAHEINVARVIVNQIHAVANGGAWDNGLNFTLTMGCGTWAGNSISENLSYRHFINVTRLVRPIPGTEPTDHELWGSYLQRYGE
jgi:sulfoacetaldehyde dehydrogenase